MKTKSQLFNIFTETLNKWKEVRYLRIPMFLLLIGFSSMRLDDLVEILDFVWLTKTNKSTTSFRAMIFLFMIQIYS